MGRVGIKISEAELRSALASAEAGRTFKNETELFTFVASTPWGVSGCKDELGRVRPLSAALIYNRVKAFKIPIKTVKGKRGNPNIGVRLTPEEKAERVQNRSHYQTSVNQVRFDIVNHYKSKEGPTFTHLPPNRENLLKRHAKGNVRAAVKLMCLQCMGGEAAECARCDVYKCPLYLINPFLKAGVKPEDADALVGEVNDSNEGDE